MIANHDRRMAWALFRRVAFLVQVISDYGRSRRCTLGLSNASSVNDAAVNTRLTKCLRGGAIAGDMSSLAAFVTDLASRVERTSIGSCTITGDMPLHMSTSQARLLRGSGYVRACHKRNTSWPALGNRERNGWAHRICSTLLGVDHQRHQQILHGNHHQTRP